MNLSDVIRTKRAVRQFLEQPLPDNAVSSILNAGRRAQSSKNTQPWRFIAIRDRATLKSLSELGTWAGHLAGAALGVAIVHNDPVERFQILFDVGQAAAYMQLSAWDMGIASCLASIYEADKARQLLGFPAELHLRIAISFGYPKDPQELTKPPQLGGRYPASEIIHWDHW